MISQRLSPVSTPIAPASTRRIGRQSRRNGPAPDTDMIWIPGGTFLMGSNDHYPEERPVHHADGRWILDGPVAGDKMTCSRGSSRQPTPRHWTSPRWRQESGRLSRERFQRCCIRDRSSSSSRRTV